MAQIKIYGMRAHLDAVKSRMSDAVHTCVVEALRYPPDKRAHRFIGLDPADFYYPPGRSERYTIIEISMFEGRTVEAKKALIRLIFAKLEHELQIAPNDVEITIFETPRHNWGIRGQLGDEMALNYTVDV
ncbi:MAG TPA: tautomerase family protein [Kouleothrix sp.]|uniref:tautomerase family protein n=1 Tax=Kouleothrix sp. TaxID=2779161 RepID=UPI002BE83E56|nr:tautomerase family protein [Kouleothrix sp.]